MINFRTLGYRLLGQRLRQRIAEHFWSQNSDTYVANSAYYDRRESILKASLASLPPIEHSLDVGCGDGRFTSILASRSVHVNAYDISPHLIKNAEARNLKNVCFDTCEIESVPTGNYDLVSCMGVTSCIHDDRKYSRILDLLQTNVRPNGYLLLIDTVATTGKEIVKAYKHGHVGKYLDSHNYVNQIIERKFSVVESRVIKDWSKTLSNRMWIFRRVK